ncbi:HDOD domain-containing protein [Natronospirillum operosum]|uniref:HDOD domain-containing protein n=1 Tax=Natronospirillum operosum TaxID=2759953 RepID=A0A4Z0W648_9GAMM|nr:HDOD domain-containing protein [Natronospirillum operosum]TGG91544.1 HDOD domain-containing protein [Natronospirillum operosum]
MDNTAEDMKPNDPTPIAVRQYLSRQGVETRLITRKDARHPVVECVLLADSLGKVALLLPADRMLDLAALRQQTGRQLAAAPLAERQQLLRKHGLQELPALDGLCGVEALADQHLPTTGEVCIQSGLRGQLLQLPASALVADAATRQVDVTVAVPEIELDYELSLFEMDRDAIEQSVGRFTAKRIRQRLEETLEIPPLPATAQEIIRLRVDPSADISKLSALVERDPSLAAQVISWASSSYYAAPGSVKSVQDAIVRVLGYDLVMNLSLGLALGKTLQMPEDEPQGFAPYWQEAVYTAAVVAELHSAMPREARPSFGLAYLTGLLSNFGYLVLAHVFKPHFSTCCRLWEANPHLDPRVVEDHVLGINRDQIAASLLNSWSLPGEVCLGIRHASHTDYYGLHSDYANLVCLSTRLLRRAGLVAGPRVPLEPALFANLQLTPVAARAALTKVQDGQDSLDALARGMES